MLSPVPLTPEISLHLAEPGRGLFDATGGAFHSERPPPFWSFAWAGGQALARYVLDHPDLVRGRRVTDLATGSGLVAIAAAKAGAAEVTAVDSDPEAVAAALRNAAANNVTIAAGFSALAGGSAAGSSTAPQGPGFSALAGGSAAGSSTAPQGPGFSALAGGSAAGSSTAVVLAGDAFYTVRVAEQMTAALLAARRAGALILVGDPGRGYLPERLFDRRARYDVPVPPALEAKKVLPTFVWEMRNTMLSTTNHL